MNKCKWCDGQGWTSEHGCSPSDATGQDCAATCPVQVQCVECEGTGEVELDEDDQL